MPPAGTVTVKVPSLAVLAPAAKPVSLTPFTPTLALAITVPASSFTVPLMVLVATVNVTSLLVVAPLVTTTLVSSNWPRPGTPARTV